MSYEIYSKENNILFNLYTNTCPKNYIFHNKLKILKGEFENYYSYNFREYKVKFFYYFIKNLFYYQEYKIHFDNIDINSKILCICTSDYIYNDNIKPITERLKSNIYFDKIKLNSKNKIGFSFKKYGFPLNIFLKKKVLLNFNNLILTLYLYLIVFPKMYRLNSAISSCNFNKYKLMITADPCDLFSRLIYNYKSNSKYLLIQNGPIFEGTPEWTSIFSDLVIGWHLNESFFITNKINYKIFFPPRFLYQLQPIISDKKYDVVFFLPWLHDNNANNPLILTLQKAINYTYNRFKKKVHIRYHPAGKINLRLPVDIFEEIDYNISTKDVLLNTHKTINMGSTVSFDCVYLNRNFGLLNFNEQIDKSSIFFTFEFAKNLKNIEDLELFLSHLETQDEKIYQYEKNDNIIKFINSELSNNE